MKKLDKTVSKLLENNWKEDFTVRSTSEDISAYDNGHLSKIPDFSSFLQKYGMIYLYDNLSSHTLPLIQGRRNDKNDTIPGAISFCNSYSEWPDKLIPFYSDKSGNFFCFDKQKKYGTPGFVVCYLHDTRDYQSLSQLSSFEDFLDYALKTIPDCWGIIQS
jgi:hypothetical protein